jgi:alanine dehydrogenase
MAAPRTLGLPRMRNEQGEKRVFLPDFVQFVESLGVQVYLEEGYGSRSGYQFADFKVSSTGVHQCTREKAFRQEVVLVLRSPRPDEFGLMRPGLTLVSMLHYPTRPLRVERLKSAGIRAISLDSIVDDNNLRLVENMKAVAWNGLEAGFDLLEKRWPGLVRPDGRPIQVLVLGAGMVGKFAVDAATKLGNVERNNEHITAGGPGSVAMCIGRSVTSSEATMRDLFSRADILVDATQRRDPSRPVVPNAWLRWLPEHAVIVDLAVDPYTLDADPPVVRGVEGIPQGNLDQYIFRPDDPAWDRMVPPGVPSGERRATVTCYSWPGVHPEACMQHYAQQLKPLMRVLFRKGYEGLSLEGEYFERALCRGTLKFFLDEQQRLGVQAG